MAKTATASNKSTNDPERARSGKSSNKSSPASNSGPSTPQGESDENYALVSILYHALKGAETYSTYIQDAQRAGDEELVEFFSECRDEENERSSRAKGLLAERLGSGGGGNEEED